MGVIWRFMLHCTMAGQCLFLGPGWLSNQGQSRQRPRLLTARFRQTSPVRFNVGSVSSNNPLGRTTAGQRHRSLGQSGGLFGDHAQCLRLGFRSSRKKFHHPQLHDSLGLDTQHCSVAGDLYPILDQHVPPRTICSRKDNLSQRCSFRGATEMRQSTAPVPSIGANSETKAEIG